jgi:hypothetical protein
MNTTGNTRQRGQLDLNQHQPGSQPRTLPIKLYPQHTHSEYSIREQMHKQPEQESNSHRHPYARCEQTTTPSSQQQYTIHHTAHHCEINGFTCILKKACTRTKSMLYYLCLTYNNTERSIHDGRGAASIPQSARMESIQAQERQERVFLCPEMASWICLHRTSRKARGNHRRQSTGVSRQSPIEIKNAGVNRLGTIKILPVARSSLEPGKLMRDGPSKSLPVSSIATHGKKCQWLYKIHGRDRKKSSYVHPPHPSIYLYSKCNASYFSAKVAREAIANGYQK